VAHTATDFRSSRALQRYSEPGRVVARLVVMLSAAPGSFEGRPARCPGRADVLFMTFRHTSGCPHTRLGKGSYDTGTHYGAGFAAVAAG
jgi:hypothetical protein